MSNRARHSRFSVEKNKPTNWMPSYHTFQKERTPNAGRVGSSLNSSRDSGSILEAADIVEGSFLTEPRLHACLGGVLCMSHFSLRHAYTSRSEKIGGFSG